MIEDRDSRFANLLCDNTRLSFMISSDFVEIVSSLALEDGCILYIYFKYVWNVLILMLSTKTSDCFTVKYVCFDV